MSLSIAYLRANNDECCFKTSYCVNILDLLTLFRYFAKCKNKVPFGLQREVTYFPKLRVGVCVYVFVCVRVCARVSAFADTS